MLHLKRLLWLAAWSVWLWLGVGLYRELPRQLGPVASTLPIGPGDSILGFSGSSNKAVVLSAKDQTSPVSIDVFNADLGALVSRTEGPPLNNVWCQSRTLHHGVLFANRLVEKTALVWLHALHLFDLETATWRRIIPGRGTDISVHPTRPWVVFNEIPRLPTGVYRVVAVDFSTQQVIFTRDLPRGAPVYHNPLFVGDRTVIPMTAGTAVPLRRDKSKNQKSSSGGSLWDEGASKLTRSIEVWRIAEPPVLEKTIEGACLGRVSSIAANGRLSFSSAPTVPSMGVFDLDEGRNVFVPKLHDDEFDDRYVRRGGLIAPRLSPSGRSVFSGNPGTLRDVETNRLLWGPLSPEYIAWPVDQELFQVIEPWHSLWRQWSSTFTFETEASRSLETGALIYRTTTDRTQRQALPRHWNASKTLAIANNGTIYRMPPGVNWPLLALCQTVLALPLLLLWAILRWRRRQRASDAQTRTRRGERNSSLREQIVVDARPDA